MKTLKTNDYGLFKLIESNRPIVHHHVGEIVKAITEIDLTEANPIIVNEKFEVVDGQHRLEACKRLGIPVYYFMINLNGNTNKAMIDLNRLPLIWRLNEYINHYAKMGLVPYKTILDCEDMFHLGVSVSTALVSNSGHSMSRSIRDGSFKAGKISYVELGNSVMSYKNICPTFYNNVKFVRSLISLTCSGVYNHRDHFHKFQKNRFQLQECANDAQYRKMFELIINKGTRKNK